MAFRTRHSLAERSARMARRMPRPHYPSLDGLRCLAILPVVWHHATTGPHDGLLGRGPLGVDLFFALSGFLITSLLLAEKPALRVFWVRRSLRIFPLYYLVLGAFVLHALWVREPGPVRDHFLANLPFYATYTSNWFLWEPVDHPIVFAFAWSLAAEEQFYLWWPPVLRCGRRIAVPAMLAMIAVDQAAERGQLSADGLALSVLRSFATPIGLGSLLALGAETRPLRIVLGQRWSSSMALGLVALAVAQPWPLFPTHIALTMLVGACALRKDHWLAALFENRVVRHVGVVSYGMYLLNIPIVAAARRYATGEILVFIVGTTASIGIATLVYYAVERPFLRLRDRYRSPLFTGSSKERKDLGFSPK